MASSIFGNSKRGNSVLAAADQLKRMGPPQAAFMQMYNSDPRFRQFADSMRGKTPEQAFMENGLDFNQFRNMMR